ncbi:MAG: type II secretion system protein, partial [Atopobiaceae bacterium]|nr:type II secretion system protein [Atopobiaceae bacterium]
MRAKRLDKGFTMMEMMVAVAIMVVLMGVAFLAVINYQRTMKRLELDQTAREIFVAAQNHLTMAQSQGLLEGLDAGDRGYRDEDADGNDYDYGLFANGSESFALGDYAKALNLMLPSFSLDDTVRLGGSYVIRYDWKSATVRDVFYSDHSSMSDVTFGSGDYDQLFGSPGYTGDEAVQSQSRLDGYGGDRNKILGWYGGADLKKASVESLSAPALTIRNAETLTVTVKPANITDFTAAPGAKIQLIMHGDTSGVDKLVKEFSHADFLVDPTPTLVLDDITVAGGHFAEQAWCQGGAGNSIIPGENITLYVRIYSNQELVREARSARKHTNSLFASIVDEKQEGAASVKTANISNIRHLENLYGVESGYHPSAVGDDGKDGATAARQTSDLRWKGSAKGFCEVIASGKSDDDPDKV